ncbi:hypothetical protein EON79_17380 [bacterium]|nr:MAG: hypothetical protein EON79_17380 [bacterium]
MSERAILMVRSHVPAQRMAAFASAQERAREFYSTCQGIHGPTIYSQEGDAETFLTLLELDSHAEFDLEMSARLTDEMAMEFHRAMDVAPSVRTIRIIAGAGPRAEALPSDSVLSISDRIADPGKAEDLARDYEAVFGSFAMLDGFLGYAYGPDGATEEHIFGLAVWRDREALNQSLKDAMRHDLRIYRRVHDGELQTVPDDFAVT